MNGNILLREFRKEDTKALQDIIREAWHYDDFAGPKTACRLAGVFLNSCLANQTYTQVAVIDGRAAGIIMGKNRKNHRCPFKYRIRQVSSIAGLLFTKEGRKVSRIFRNVNGIDKELLENCDREYQGELSFFAVNQKYRGMGVGRILFDTLVTYMNSEGVQDFYLFTDTSCNFGFYEHQGMKRRQEKSHRFLINGREEEMHFFVYDYEC